MRLRSFASDPQGTGHGPMPLKRAPYSKIQNNALSIKVGDRVMEWYSDLRPMLRKDGPSIATAIIRIVSELCDIVKKAAKAGERRRVIHCLTGDGVNTNINAAKRVFWHMKQTYNIFKYYLLVWLCSSHQSNLVVSVAICGPGVARPEDTNPICMNASRFYKHLTPQYAEEFGFALGQHIREN